MMTTRARFVTVALTCAALALSAAPVSMLSGCRLQGVAGAIGSECDDAGDCDDPALGCVPLNPDNPAAGTACMPPPTGWICPGDLYGDRVCDCGCGENADDDAIDRDIDCPNALSTSCGENGNQCPTGQDPVATDNTRCQ